MFAGLADFGNAWLGFMNPTSIALGLGGALLGIIVGILPGLLGLVTILLGALMTLRSWRRGGRLVSGPQFAMSGESARRLAVVVGLIVAYTVVLLGRGLPFWLGATIYVTASIMLLQAPQRAAEGRGLTLREAAVALAIGLASGWIITWVFQDAFLVRLP